MYEHTPVIREAVITNLSLNGDGFAELNDGTGTAYIPPTVAKSANLIPGEIRTLSVIPNYEDKREITEWLGVFVAAPATSMPEAHGAKPEREDGIGNVDLEAIMEIFQRPHTHYLTLLEVVEDLGDPDVDKGHVAAALRRLYGQGRLVRADVRRAGAAKAQLVLWAQTREDFLS